MYCAKCGNKLTKNAEFCSICGEKAINIEQTEVDSKNIKEEIEEKEDVEIVEYQCASQGKRFINFLIDYVLIAKFVIPFFVGLLFPYEEEITWYIIIMLFITLYFFLLETFTGKTLGKLLTKTRILNTSMETPTAGQVLIRTLCRFIPFDTFSYLSSRPVGWHDSISKTYVVEEVIN